MDPENDPFIDVVSLFSCDYKHVNDINKLVVQLSPRARQLTENAFFNILHDKKDFVVYAMKDYSGGMEKTVGMATIFYRELLTGWVGEIHDVTVDETYRGRHFGDLLVKHMLNTTKTKAEGLGQPIRLSLTSKPSNPNRQIAIQMYLKHGFKLIAEAVKLPDGGYDPEGTNLYRKTIEP